MKTFEIHIKIDATTILKANLSIPDAPQALVIFAHGSGSSRLSIRNRHVAEFFNTAHIATLLTDLLTDEEDQRFETRFNIPMLTSRLVKVTNYIIQFNEFRDLSVGYFGASTGAASALQAASELDGLISAVVSRGGRPDLVVECLSKVEAPTLFIVGSLDPEIVDMNQMAFQELTCDKELKIMEGAGHLFEENGCMDQLARWALDWFTKHLILNYKPSLIL